jgi:hypothetical protein
VYFVPTIIALVDQPNGRITQCAHKCAALATPLGVNLDVEFITDDRVPTAVTDPPKVLQVSQDVRLWHCQEVAKPVKFRMIV